MRFVETNALLLKYSAAGQQEWWTGYDGGPFDDRLTDIAVDGSGNIYVTGSSSSPFEDLSYATLKYDPDGNRLWVVRPGDDNGMFDGARALALGPEGSVFVTGKEAVSKGNQSGNMITTIKYAEASEQFSKISSGSIVTDAGLSRGCAWGDYDGDGKQDLLVANWAHSGDNNFLYYNAGTGFWRDNSNAVANDGLHSEAVTWGDYDNDGFLDLFVANWQQNALFHNNSDGTFEQITNGDIGTDNLGDSEGCAWGDYNNEGHLDLFVAKYNDDNKLFVNRRDGTFKRVSGVPMASGDWQSRSSSWADYDNDGDLDLLVTNIGHNSLYSNDGSGGFTQLLDTIIDDVDDPRGSAWADYDMDGDLDLFVAIFENNNSLYENMGNEHHWLNIRCIGTVSNKSAIGTKVRAKAIIGGFPAWQMREISGQTGTGGQNSLNVQFGFREAIVVDSLVIEWPSGLSDVLTNVNVDQHIEIVENDIFSPVLTGDITGDGGESFASAWADYDSDGDLDLFVANSEGNNQLFSNNGDGSFALIEFSDQQDSFSGVWGDYDNDGDPDLFVANFNGNNFLLNNDGQGNLSSITQGEIVSDGGGSLGASWGDIDNDSDLYLFVANNTTDFLYINNSDGTFIRRTTGPVATAQFFSTGSAFGDYDNDGDLDLFVPNTAGQNNFLFGSSGNGTSTVSLSIRLGIAMRPMAVTCKFRGIRFPLAACTS